mgnify:CR=1 FL=1
MNIARQSVISAALNAGQYQKVPKDEIQPDVYYYITSNTGTIKKNAYGREFIDAYDVDNWSEVLTTRNGFPAASELLVTHEELENGSMTLTIDWSQKPSKPMRGGRTTHSRINNYQTPIQEDFSVGMDDEVDDDFKPSGSHNRNLSQFTSLMDNIMHQSTSALQDQLNSKDLTIQQLQDQLQEHIEARTQMGDKIAEIYSQVRREFQTELNEKTQRINQLLTEMNELRTTITREFQQEENRLRGLLQSANNEILKLKEQVKSKIYEIKELKAYYQNERRYDKLRREMEDSKGGGMQEMLGMALQALPMLGKSFGGSAAMPMSGLMPAVAPMAAPQASMPAARPAPPPMMQRPMPPQQYQAPTFESADVISDDDDGFDTSDLDKELDELNNTNYGEDYEQ